MNCHTGNDVGNIKKYYVVHKKLQCNFTYLLCVTQNNFKIYLGKYADSSKFPPTLWKYAPMADPSVIEGHFRNLSQIIIAREISAVNDWKENSEEVFHFMRDHPMHKFTINDGLMGKYSFGYYSIFYIIFL